MPFDTLNRRLRFHRKRSGRAITPTERDVEIFRLLQRHRYLRSTFIHAFLGGNQKRVVERLGDLFHEGYLNRPPQQWQAFNARYAPAIYELDDRAERFLRDNGYEREKLSDLVARGRMGANRELAHALMIVDTLASVELGIRHHPDIRFISWQEILAKAPQTTRRAKNPFSIPVSLSHTFPRTSVTHTAAFGIVPDALFGLEYTADGRKLCRFFALEAERSNRVYCSNLHQTSWLKKVLAYRHITADQTYHSHLGLPNLMVIVVTPNSAKLESMKKLIMEVTKGRGSTQFLFKAIPVLGDRFKAPLPALELFTAPWSRAGHPDFTISEA